MYFLHLCQLGLKYRPQVLKARKHQLPKHTGCNWARGESRICTRLAVYLHLDIYNSSPQVVILYPFPANLPLRGGVYLIISWAEYWL